VELQANPTHNYDELYATSSQYYQYEPSELHGGGYHNTTEPHSSTPRPELDASVPSFSHTPAPAYQYPSPKQAYQQQSRNDIHELYPRSPEPHRSIVQRQLSSDDITALEEERRRIDAEMEEVRRMKELRDQKMAIQQKLKDAKGP
jgi:hypothetical protein